MKAITMIYMMGLPIYSHGLLKGMGLFILGHLVCGELLATMFIVNHVIEGVSYGAKTVQESTKGKGAKPATVNGDTPMEKTRQHVAEDKSNAAPFVPYNDWAAVQCQTSVNWSPGSWFWNHFSGGLSHQIEHHLFPSICHTVSLCVEALFKQTCQQFYSSFHYLHVGNRTIITFKMLSRIHVVNMASLTKVSLTYLLLMGRC